MLDTEIGSSGGRRLTDLEAERVGRMLEVLGSLGREEVQDAHPAVF